MLDNLTQEKQQIKTPLFKTTELSPLKVTDFVDFPPSTTPGNVGVCLSGGGSRAMVAGMGQLQALKKLSNEEGSLLGQVKALSTVSGGSWVGVPFSYLPLSYSDDDFLGVYFPPAAYSVDTVQQISQYQIGARCLSNFSPVHLGIQLVGLLIAGIPDYMVWQTLVGIHILKFYGLYIPQKEEHDTPFSYDKSTLSKIIIENPSLKNNPFYLVAKEPSHVRRPYLICNGSMFVNTPPLSYQPLAPLQMTSFFVGIMSNPPSALDASSELIKEGGIAPVAFNSDPLTIDQKKAEVSLTQFFSLADAVGISSSFFAECLQDLGKRWQNNLGHFFEDVGGKLETAWDLLSSHIPKKHRERFVERLTKMKLLKSAQGNLVPKKLEGAAISPTEFNAAFAKLAKIVPKYNYWSIESKEKSTACLNSFADGGNLENTGIAGLLSYQDIQRIISFMNSSTPLEIASFGILDKQGKQITGTNIKIDSCLPPLFGYQPYDDKIGYQLYKESAHPKYLQFCNNQLFPSEAFQETLLGLWSASGNQTNPGSNQHSAIYQQDLQTVDNQWFGIKGGRTVSLLWVYNNFVQDWYNQLSASVQEEIFKNNPKSFFNFPHYNTIDTQLTASQVNLLANLSAWNILEGNAQAFLNMFIRPLA